MSLIGPPRWQAVGTHSRTGLRVGDAFRGQGPERQAGEGYAINVYEGRASDALYESGGLGLPLGLSEALLVAAISQCQCQYSRRTAVYDELERSLHGGMRGDDVIQ